jgi:hypothetical protein
MAENYSVVRKHENYTLVQCDSGYEVHLVNGEHIQLSGGIPGLPGQPGAPGPPPSEEVVAQAVADYIAAQGPPYVEVVLVATTEAVVAHSFAYNPTVTVVDTLGNNLGVSPIFEPGQVRIPLGNFPITVTVTLR